MKGGEPLSEERKAAERMIFRVVGTAVALAACVWLLPIVWDKLSPFIIAIPLAALLQPLIEFLQKKLKMKRGLATVILVLLGLGVAFGVLTFILIHLFKMEKKDHEAMQKAIKEKHDTGKCRVNKAQRRRLERIAGHKWEDMWIGNSITL